MNLFSFLFVILGLLLIFGVKPLDVSTELVEKLKRKKKKYKLSEQIDRAKKGKKTSGIVLFFSEIYEILRVTERLHLLYGITLLSIVTGFVGLLLGLYIGGMAITVALVLVFSMIPFLYIRITANKFKSLILAELETALGIITTSYMRGENTFIAAVEENIDVIGEPLRSIFGGFLMNSKYISSNLKGALLDMKKKLDNRVFHEWIDAIVICQSDHTQKSSLVPIVRKLSDIRITTLKLELIVAEPFYEFLLMILTVVTTPLLFYFLNSDWYAIIMSDIGKVILAVLLIVSLIATIDNVKNLRPVELQGGRK